MAPAALVGVIAAVFFIRFLTVDREVVSAVPSPRAVFSVDYIELAPQKRLCLSDVTIPSDADRLRVQVRTYGQPGPAFEIALRGGGGYAERLRVSAGYRDGATLDVPMRPPPAARLGDVCLRQSGTRTVALVGTIEPRTQSRPTGTIDGKLIASDTYLAFYEARKARVLHESNAIIERMSAFRPGIVDPPLLWALLVLAVVGIPGGVVWAVLRAARA